ncbi:unnamed protein product [Peronospora farinosa]|uniref:Uncharacterized protein n=1 Tax=Peronospora farinosa TaxID=134698 RepID=A0AAV0STJ4_9STRA|nr:unnamed protein product [Peronospora farinosa]CAI5707967.1 unnamed protein product [Peronospora farinosa]
MTALSPRLFLAFDDFSRAGKHVLRFTKFNHTEALPMPQNILETVFPLDLCQFIQIYQYPDQQVAIITVHTADLEATELWKLADALVSAMSQANVETLTILTALHLPYVKNDDLDVFYRGFNIKMDKDVDIAALSEADPMWEIKDPWLIAFLHLIKIEQWPCTHLLVAKGYKPGRDLSGMYEAMDKLSRALQLFTREKMMVDMQHMHRELPKLLAMEKKMTTDEGLTLLYH